ncbi:chemotaxis protein CheX [Candidatus Latescibacterota bacterium]
MDPSLRSSENDAELFSILKEILIDTVRKIFRDSYGLTIERSHELSSCDDEYLTYNNISSSIEFHGKLVGIVIIIVEKKFARHLLMQMGLGALSPEEESEYIHDSMGELLNIILGNATNVLLEKNISIGIEPPSIFNFENQDVDMIKQNAWIYQINTAQGKCCLVLKNN